MQRWFWQVVVSGLVLLAGNDALAQGRQGANEPKTAAAARGEGDAARLKRAQDTVLRVLGGASSLDQLDATQKAELYRALDEIRDMLPSASQATAQRQRARFGSLSSVAQDCGVAPGVADELSDEQRMDLSKAVVEIKKMLLADEKNQLTCHHERKTGTNIIELRCQTLAAREQNAQDAQEAFREWAATPPRRH